MTPEEQDQFIADLKSLAMLLGPFVLLALVLLLNVVLHHDTYVRPMRDAYVAPVVTTGLAPAEVETSTTLTTSTTTTTTTPATTAAPAVLARDFDLLADCESGDHDTLKDGSWRIHRGTARWHIANRVHQGGVQFAVSTWDAFAPDGFPADAHLATREQQIVVAELVLEAQGPRAWPKCGRIVGLR